MCAFTGFRRHSRWAHRMGWPPFQPTGELRLALLALVAEQPDNGYGLMQKLNGRAGGYYRARAQTVYPLLQQLEDEGLIVAEIQERRRVYRITGAGLRELRRRADEVQDLWHSHEPREWRRDLDAAAADIRDAAERVVRTVRGTLSDELGAAELSAATIARVREILERAIVDLEDAFGARH